MFDERLQFLFRNAKLRTMKQSAKHSDLQKVRYGISVLFVNFY